MGSIPKKERCSIRGGNFVMGPCDESLISFVQACPGVSRSSWSPILLKVLINPKVTPEKTSFSRSGAHKIGLRSSGLILTSEKKSQRTNWPAEEVFQTIRWKRPSEFKIGQWGERVCWTGPRNRVVSLSMMPILAQWSSPQTRILRSGSPNARNSMSKFTNCSHCRRSSRQSLVLTSAILIIVLSSNWFQSRWLIFRQCRGCEGREGSRRRKIRSSSASLDEEGTWSVGV